MNFIRRASLAVGRRLMAFGEASGNGLPRNGVFSGSPEYSDRIRQELEHYREVENVHDLPEIFHFWSNRFIRPKLEEVLGVSGFPELCVQYIQRCRSERPGELVEVHSLGAGNAEIEIPIAEKLREQGVEGFNFCCLDLNPDMLRRGRELAEQRGLAAHFQFVEVDLANWRPQRPASIVMAHHSLHHMVELEAIFRQVREAIGEKGYFLANDMIGRNGHMRWPEALQVLQEIWKSMPNRYKYNHQLRRFEQEFQDWDCSTEGFEGIRSQDILPLLVGNFQFESFVAYGNLPDVLVDRSFGHNFDVNRPEDTEFIDRVGVLNDRLIDEGVIKPTQMMAVMRLHAPGPVRCYKHWTPQYCIRPPAPKESTLHPAV